MSTTPTTQAYRAPERHATPAPGTYRIEVTDRDIREGKPCSPTECPVALAVIRSFRAMHVVVDIEKAIIYPTHESCRDSVGAVTVDLPELAVDFAQNYDKGIHAHVPEPFAFDLEIPVTESATAHNAH